MISKPQHKPHSSHGKSKLFFLVTKMNLVFPLSLLYRAPVHQSRKTDMTKSNNEIPGLF